jgi:hypothetical protein
LLITAHHREIGFLNKFTRILAATLACSSLAADGEEQRSDTGTWGSIINFTSWFRR